jgi:hypothetical protein
MRCLDSVVYENYEAYGVQTRATGVGCVKRPEWSVSLVNKLNDPLEGPMRRRDDLR